MIPVMFIRGSWFLERRNVGEGSLAFPRDIFGDWQPVFPAMK
jgi:hypothetical protein